MTTVAVLLLLASTVGATPPAPAPSIGLYADAAGTSNFFAPQVGVPFNVYVVLFAEDLVNAVAYDLDIPGLNTDVFINGTTYGPSGGGVNIPSPTGNNVGLGECAIGIGGTPILVSTITLQVSNPIFPSRILSITPNTDHSAVNAVYSKCTGEIVDVPIGPSLTLQSLGDVPVLLAMNDVDQSVGVDELLSIPDPTTGVGALIGSLGDNFIETEALAARSAIRGPQKAGEPQPAEVPLDEVYAVDNDFLLAVDPNTGNGIPIGPIGFPDVDGIAFHPFNGNLYGVTYGTNQLLQINPLTGQGTLIASDVISGRRLEDIAFHPDGSAFVLTSGPRLYEIDLATGAKLARWELSGASSLESLVWSPDGQTLYSAADRNGTKDLVTIELLGGEVGTITFVSQDASGFSDIEALVFLGRRTVDVLRAALAPTPVDSDAQAPRTTRLLQNVPNPFNPSTSIHFELQRSAPITLTVFDSAGRRVATLLSGVRDAGAHVVQWNGRTDSGQTVAAGVYHSVLETPQSRSSLRMVLVK